MKRIIFILCVIIGLISCREKNSRQSGISLDENLLAQEEGMDIPLEPLSNETVKYTDKDFGEIIDLNSKQIATDFILTVSEAEMLVKDNLLILKNPLPDGNVFSTFTLPDFTHIKSFGRIGRGPNEFMFPKIMISHDSDSILFYAYESGNNTLYSVDEGYDIREIKAFNNNTNRDLGSKFMLNISNDHFLYTESTNNGKAVFDMRVFPDSIAVNQIYDLSFSKKYKSWASYIGDFGVNTKKNRMVYAYKYFKRVVFIDIETGNTKTLEFDNEGIQTTNTIATLGPDNITYYWGMTTTDNYIYCLYSGRTPIQASQENAKGPGYIYVEQFDWNGNPVRKFKLDNWGYFTVDEENNKIYLASAVTEYPFFVYDMPER